MGRHRIQLHTNGLTATNHTERRNHTFIGSKMAETTTNYNQHILIGQRNQPARNNRHKIQKLFEINHTNENAAVKTSSLPNTAGSTADTITFKG